MGEALDTLLTGYVLRYTLVVGAVLTVALYGVGTELLYMRPRSVLFFAALFALGLAPVPFSISDSGLESAAVSVGGGFDVTNPSRYRAGSDGPLRFKTAFALAGIGAYSLLGFLALGAL